MKDTDIRIDTYSNGIGVTSMVAIHMPTGISIKKEGHYLNRHKTIIELKEELKQKVNEKR